MNTDRFCSAVRWHAAPRPAGSSGREVLHLSPSTSAGKPQRGWKGQPDGGLSMLGGDPGMGVSGSFTSELSRGMDPSSPQAYGCWGALRILRTEPGSTARPAYNP